MEGILLSFEYFSSVIKSMAFANWLDVLLLWFLFYKTYVFVRDTRAIQLVKGFIFIFLLLQISQLLNFSATSFVIKSILEFGALALLVVFQPELRSLLERLGRGSKKYKLFFNNEENQEEYKYYSTFNEIQSAVQYMSATKTGALIVLERDTKLGEHTKSGTVVDAMVSSEMLLSIFYPNSSLHDGAVIIRDNRIYAAACFLPLSQNTDISHDLGTRHRAALGISEVSDCICIVVSEETGIISVAVGGKLIRKINTGDIAGLLKTYFLDEKDEEGFNLKKLLNLKFKKGGKK